MAFRIEEKDFSHPDVGKIFSEKNTLYSSGFWIHLYREDPRFKIFIIYLGNDPVGGFYLFCSRRLWGKLCTNPTFSPVNGWILRHEKKTGYLENTFLKETGNAFADFIKKELRPTLLITSFPVHCQSVLAIAQEGLLCRPSYTYILNLESGSMNKISERMSLKVRKSVRISENDFYFEKNVPVNVLKDLLYKTMQRKGKKNSLHFPKKIFEQADPLRSYSFTAYHKETRKPVAFSFCVHDEHTSYALFNGYDASLPSSQTVKACLYLSIEEAIQRGLQRFDFEGSMIPEIEKSYREFGGNPEPYFYVSYCPSVLKPFASFLFPSYF